jgi:hypothetical protein
MSWQILNQTRCSWGNLRSARLSKPHHERKVARTIIRSIQPRRLTENQRLPHLVQLRRFSGLPNRHIGSHIV